MKTFLHSVPPLVLIILFTIVTIILVFLILFLRLRYIYKKEEKEFNKQMRKFTENDK
jgi:Flp pilus assembly protein TadB